MNLNVPLMILHLKALKILAYVINITAVYQLEGISLQKGKAPPNHAVMSSWVFWRPHHALTCSQCDNKVCLNSDVPCKKDNISVFKHLFSVAYNFLDERNGNKTDLHNDLYTCIDAGDGLFPDYICMSCQPFFLKSVKIENEYNETKKMFQEKQGCSTPLIMQPDISHDNKQDLSEESVMNPAKKQSNISADKKVLGRDFAVPDAFLFEAGIFTEVLNEIRQTALTGPTGAGDVSEALSSPLPVYTVFQIVISDISPWTVSFTEHTKTNNTTKVTFSLSNTWKVLK